MPAQDQIVIYPDRAALRRFLVRNVLLLLGWCAVIVLSPLRPDMMGVVLLWGVLGVCVYGCVLAFVCYRLIRPRPAMLIQPEGITDLGSCIIGGVGLIRWEEMQAVVPI